MEKYKVTFKMAGDESKTKTETMICEFGGIVDAIIQATWPFSDWIFKSLDVVDDRNEKERGSGKINRKGA